MVHGVGGVSGPWSWWSGGPCGFGVSGPCGFGVSGPCGFGVSGPCGFGVSVFHSFAIGVGNFFYNGDMRNLKTVMTGEAVDKSVDKLWITFLCLEVEYTITLINTRCLSKLLYEL